MVPRAMLIVGSFLLASIATAQVGSVLRRQAIGPATGGFTGTLMPFDGFGASLASLGDLNGDGTGDLAVAAPGDDDGGPNRGAIWILFLGPSGTVLSQTKISQTQGGFTGVLRDFGGLGLRMVNVGDLDGDGVPELAAYSAKQMRFWILFLKSDGTLKRQVENRFDDPVFGGQTRPSYFNGERGVGGMEALGDLDGDGVGDLALGSPYDSGGSFVWTGALWIVRLKADGTMKAAHKISQTQGGFTGTLLVWELFGYEITQLGDLDGDGDRELGVRSRQGGFWILNLDANEFVSNQVQAEGAGDTWLGDLDGDGFGELLTGGQFGQGVYSLYPDGRVRRQIWSPGSLGLVTESLGDLDGDGQPEVAVGEGLISFPTNFIEIVTLDVNAVRNGSGVNPQTLSQASEPVIGSTWSATLNCTGHASGVAALFGLRDQTGGVFTPYGEVLVTGQHVFDLTQPHTGGPTLFQVLVPNRTDLIGLPISIQGVCTGGPRARLSNALDVVVGK